MANITKGSVILNTYEIIDIIGAGGGGVTYKARHLRLNTDVVVKRVKDEVVNKIDVQAEANILKNLKHQYLPRIYDFVQTNDGVYTVIDFIPGDNLEDAVKKHGPFDQKTVLKWANQLSEALAYLHSQNPPIIHSDIKPANIMLTNAGDICLIDFNISLALGESAESAVGISPGFSPPEQFGSPNAYVSMVLSSTGIGNTPSPIGNPYANQNMSQSGRPSNYNYQATEVLGGGTGTEIIEDGNQGGYVSTPVGGYGASPMMGNPSPSRPQFNPQIYANTITQTDYANQMGRGIDARSDIYSLGMTLIYVLTGTKSSLDYSQRVLISDTRVIISEGLEAIITKMVNYNPDYRYNDGVALLKAIRNIHKLDGRYKVVHRIQNVIQFVALGFFIVGIGLISYSVLSQINSSNSAYSKAVDAANRSIEDGDFEDAEDYIDDAIRIDPSRPDAYRERIYLLYSLGMYEDAIEEGIDYINSPSLQSELKGKAEKQFNSNAQSIGDIYYLIGESYYEMGEIKEAKSLIEQALELNKTNGLYYRDYAIILAKTGDTEGAMECLDEAEELDIASDSVYLVKGQIAYAEGKYEDAIEYLEDAISNAESVQLEKRAILMCADCYNKMGPGYADDCIEMLTDYADDFEGTSGLMIKEYLAKAYMVKAESEPDYNNKALDVFNEIIDSGYATFQTYENVAVLYGNMKRYDEALSVLHKLEADYPGNYEVYKDLAFMEIYIQNDRDQSQRNYSQFDVYYQTALELCKATDDEMEMLQRARQDLVSGGWLND